MDVIRKALLNLHVSHFNAARWRLNFYVSSDPYYEKTREKMLNRSSSSRRRRSPRGSATSPQSRPVSKSATTSPGRRASIAASPVDGEHASFNSFIADMSMNRIPRHSHSVIPDVALASSETIHLTDSFTHSRSNLLPEDISPRNSLSIVPSVRVPTTTPRHSVVSVDGYPTKSPRNSLVPESHSYNYNYNWSPSPRNSIAPDASTTSRSPRRSIVSDTNRSPRSSLVPDCIVASSNLTAEFNLSPRSSLVPCPEIIRAPRYSLPSSEQGLKDDEVRMSRHSIGPDSSRSPRTSFVQESLSKRNSPRGSIGSDCIDKSPRGSIGHENLNKSPRGSVIRSNLVSEEGGRNRRGSITLTFQEPPTIDRRHSNESGIIAY